MRACEGCGQPIDVDDLTRKQRFCSRKCQERARASLGIRFDGALLDRLKAAAAERELSVNWLVNRAVEQFLDRLIPVDEMRYTYDTTPGRTVGQ